jgi:hypothetical protein
MFVTSVDNTEYKLFTAVNDTGNKLSSAVSQLPVIITPAIICLPGASHSITTASQQNKKNSQHFYTFFPVTLTLVINLTY